MLKSRVVFYPGAGINDGETFEVFTRSHAAHCVIHVDLNHDPQLVSSLVNGEIPGPHAHIAGYRPLAQQVFAPDAFKPWRDWWKSIRSGRRRCSEVPTGQSWSAKPD